MDYRAVFAISASGMEVEKARLDVTAANLANMHSAKGADGKPYQPLRVVSAPAAGSFATGFDSLRGAASGGIPLRGARVAAIAAQDVPPRLVFEPASPDADANGYVHLPGVDHLNEMVTMSAALRAYQANVAAFNAGKTMALKALDLGGGQ